MWFQFCLSWDQPEQSLQLRYFEDYPIGKFMNLELDTLFSEDFEGYLKAILEVLGLELSLKIKNKEGYL